MKSLTYEKTEGSDILEHGSYLQKLAIMNNFTEVRRLYDRSDTAKFQLGFVSKHGFVDVMRGCKDILRPVSTAVEISFKLEMQNDPEMTSNARIFDLIAETAVNDKLNIVAGKVTLWPVGMSKEEMEVKLDLFEE